MSVAGSGQVQLSQGLYAVYLQHQFGFGLQLDTIALSNEKGYRLLVEAEDYTAYHNVGGDMIQKLPVSGCGGGYILYGLDTVGEWTQYIVPIAQAGTFRAGIICQGEFNVQYQLTLVFTDITPTEPATWGAIKSLYE